MSSTPWLRPRKSRGIPVSPQYHLIVTEGTKTEPNYFRGLQHDIDTVENGRYRGKIQLEIKGMGMNTLSLLKTAENHVRCSINPIRHVWVVFDKDDFPADNFDMTCKRCRELSNGRITYHALWSNQCIELWFLLHFTYFQEDISRKAYYSKLSGHLKHLGVKRYDKNLPHIYEILKPYFPRASENAKKLQRLHKGLLPSQSAPQTMVYQLFDLLARYIESK